jgi:hypothetical protein
MSKNSDLYARIIEYKNEELVSYFAEKNGTSKNVADFFFLQLKKWLFLKYCFIVEDQNFLDKNLDLPIFVQLKNIDEMWHTFILFTQDYVEFCESHFGFLIHHKPVTSKSSESIYCEKSFVTKFAKLVVHFLGKNTLCDWFVKMPAMH